VGPLFANKEDFENKQNPQFLGAAQLQADLIPGGPLRHRVDKTVGHKGTVITKEIYEEILGLVSLNQIPDKKIRIEDEGDIRIDAGNVQALGRRYLVAKRQADVDTWWSAILYRVPLVNVDLTPGILVSLGLFVAVTLAILYTWNLKKWSDLLIETQTEMRKVSWPKKNELIGSSMVVIICVLVLGIYLYVVDILLTTIADQSGLLR
jgi:preprotein translocase subunit SecE